MSGRDTIARIEAVERDAWLDIYDAAPASVRTTLGLAQRRANDGALFACRAIDHMQFNRLGYLGVSQPPRGDTLDAALAEFDAAGVKNFVVHVADGSDPLADLCAARGLTPHPRTWAKFVRDAAPARTVTTALTLREAGAGDADAFGATAAAGFGMPPALGEWLGALVGRPRWRCLIAYERETPVATGAVYIDGACGWLGIGATLSHYRKRGAQSAILAARIDIARNAGCTLLTTETGIPHPGETGPSYANIQRAGFTVAYPRPNWRRE